jgi:hypothetical protein
MPIETEETTEGLKPVGIGKAAQNLAGPKLISHEDDYLLAQPDHSGE